MFTNLSIKARNLFWHSCGSFRIDSLHSTAKFQMIKRKKLLNLRWMFPSIKEDILTLRNT